MKVIASICLLLSTTPAWAVPADSTAAAASVAVPDITSLVLRMVFSLGAVLLLIWGAVHLLQRFSGKTLQGKASAYVRVLDRTYLAPKKAVYVLQIGNRSLAVGVTDTQITPLAELDPEDTRTAFPTPNAINGTPSFANLLKDVRTKFAGGQAS